MDTTILNNLNKNNNPIGILDSGVGGLTVLNRLMKVLPNENYIYFGDTKNLPYGNKTPKELFKLVTEILDFFESKNVKAVVFGCNTTAAAVYEQVKNLYDFEIYPIIQNASAKINPQKFKRIGVFATQATVSSKMYTKSLKTHNPSLEVFELACPEWVGFVENQKEASQEAFSNISKQMDVMKLFSPDKIILGCTHYPYLLDALSKFEEKEKFINPANAFVEYIKEDLANKNLLSKDKNGECQIWVSKDPQNFLKAGKMFFPDMPMPLLHISESENACSSC